MVVVVLFSEPFGFDSAVIFPSVRIAKENAPSSSSALLYRHRQKITFAVYMGSLRTRLVMAFVKAVSVRSVFLNRHRGK